MPLVSYDHFWWLAERKKNLCNEVGERWGTIVLIKGVSDLGAIPLSYQVKANRSCD